ncbi:DUF2892 domain-containing protein [Bacillota bacterium Lsc_1132]
MSVKPNINILNALIRITIGLTIVAWGTAKLVKRPWRESYLLAILLGAMKVGEGIVRYCPVTALYDKYVQTNSIRNSQNGQNASRDSVEGMVGDEVLPYNPT